MNKTFIEAGLLVLAGVISLSMSGMACGEEPGGPKLVEFDTDVRPIFRDHCVRCHGPAEKKGGLNLSSWEGVRRGGESGSSVVDGQPEQGTLWQKVAGGEMPPDRPLPEHERETLQRWIQQGAQGSKLEEHGSGEHWAFLPLDRATLPEVQNTSRLRTEIDHFVQSELESLSLTLSDEAARHVLIRRVSFDVTGLPPAADDIDTFLNDSSDDAYQQMVDRYLASPHYGERWGKHWLDAAGYADSNGYFSADTDRPYAFRYRDYVIRSFNSDKPFDRFLQEQLAGDEMARFRPGEPTTPETIELLEATHFLRNGQDGTDIGVQEPEAFEIDRRAALEAAVQVTASSLLGLTFHCARCHDHKFEPLTQKEYYQFQAILFPAFNPQDWVNPTDRIVYAWLPGEKEDWEERERQIAADLEKLRHVYQEWTAIHREPSELLLSETFEDESWQTRWTTVAPGDDGSGGDVAIGGESAAAAVEIDGHLRIIAGADEAWLSTKTAFDWTPAGPGDWIQATFDVTDNKVSGAPAARLGYSIAAHDFDDSGSVAGGNLLIDGNPSAETTVYRDYPGADSAPAGAIGGQGYVPGRNFGIRVTRTDGDKYRLEHRVDGLIDGKSLELTAADLPDGGFAFFFSSGRSFVVDNLRIETSTSQPADPAQLVALREQIEQRHREYAASRKQLEDQRTSGPGRAVAWVTDKSSGAPEVPFLTRGQYHLRDGFVDAAAPQILSAEDHQYHPAETVEKSVTTGRRLGLAKWLTERTGRPAALAARVHTNRIWARYFGRGIVPTTDNLGQSGAPASHPALLNYLAFEFQDHGWSQKWLHRQILCSAVYRQSSAASAAGLSADPDNRRLWRWPVRRLDAESLRDGMLMTAGLLDPALYGPYVPTEQTASGEVVVGINAAGGKRRSIYLQQRRSQTLSLLKVFDSPSIATVCSSRSSSTVPLQSLALLNSEFSVDCAEAFAARLIRSSPVDTKFVVRQAWLEVTGRPATSREEDMATEFLNEQRAVYKGETAELRAIADMCQMLLAGNSFLYLE